MTDGWEISPRIDMRYGREDFIIKKDICNMTFRKATIGDLEILTATRVEFQAYNHPDLLESDKLILYAKNKDYFKKLWTINDN